MNAKQLQYALELSRALNFSQVAERLNISQPALSKQIIALEQELGVRLFDRSTTPLTLTAAGEHFVQEAQELLLREKQLKRSMESFQSGERGRLDIGISPFRSFYLAPPIVRKLKERYPGLRIVLHEPLSAVLRKEVAESKYDFAIINLPVDDSVLDITLLEPDTLVLAVPNSMADSLPATPGKTLPEVSFRDCRNLPFIVINQAQELRPLFNKFCAAADFLPEIAMEVGGITTAWAMCRVGIGATLLPLQFITDSHLDDSISLFALKDNAYTRQPAIVTRKGQYLSEYARYAINLLTGKQETP